MSRENELFQMVGRKEKRMNEEIKLLDGLKILKKGKKSD